MPSLARWLVAVVLGTLALLLWPKHAEAYPWMIRHEYRSCPTCHTDPSGGGLLTKYGRVQAAVLLSSRFAGGPEDDPGKTKDFLFGAIELPEQLDLQAWLRNAYMINMQRGDVVDDRLLFMRADVGAHVALGAFRASGTIGAAHPDARALTQDTWVTSNVDGVNLVSREHWAGVALLDEALLIRAGRLNMPFGLRNVEHNTWVRSATRTDINQHQQHGVAAAYNGEKIRGELMAVLGNYQLGPDAYRERGYSAFAEYAVLPKLGAGVSSSVLRADADVATRRPVWRQGHGIFARYSPWKPLALMAEADLVIKSVKLDNPSTDVAGMLQADVEVLQGLHLVGTGELLTQARQNATLVGGWISAWWFLFAHVDARIDLVHRTVAENPATTTLLFQLHGWL